MTLASTNDYWISSTSLHIGRNAMGDYNKLQCSVQSGAVVMCFMRGVDGLGYDNGHNYQRWPLTAYPTVFHDDVARYVYIAIPKPGAKEKVAQVVFPSQMIDIYGCNEAGEQVGNSSAYYIWTRGILGPSVSNTGSSQPREWEADIDTGSLATDQAFAEQQQSVWYEYNSITDQVKFLKDIIDATIINLKSTTAKITNAIVNTLTLGGRQLTGVATTGSDSTPATPENSDTSVVTPAYGKEMYLSRRHDDTMRGTLTIKGDMLVAKSDDGTEHYIGSSEFLEGLLGQGWRAYFNGHIEADSLSIRKFLEVPELRYNRTSITTGLTWHTVGAGIIEEVTQSDYPYIDTENHQHLSAHGMIKLKLEDGEVGAVAYNDLAMGIWHNLGDSNTTMNETEEFDGHDGNFTFAGFQTIYFRVVALCHKDGVPVEYAADGTIKTHYDKDGNDITCRNSQYFLYELREKSEGTHGWQREFHPVSGMHFACYANRTNKDRQSCWYQTTTYFIMLSGMIDWTYDSSSIQVILGQRTGFTLRIRQWDTGEDVDYQLQGIGAAFGNVTRWGSETIVDRAPSVISQQLLWCSSDKPFDDIRQLTFADILKMNWRSVQASAPKPTQNEPYLYQRWLTTYDNGKTSDQYAVEYDHYFSAHPEILPYLASEYQEEVKNYSLVCDYQVINPIGWEPYITADGGRYITKGGGAYNALGQLHVSCYRYNGLVEITDGYLCYSIDGESAETEYTGPVHMINVVARVTFFWYSEQNPETRVLWRKQSVSIVEDTPSLKYTRNNNIILPRNETDTYRVYVMYGGKDATTLFDDSHFTWSRISGDSDAARKADAEWAERRKADLHRKFLVVSDKDFYKSASFDCEFDDGR